MQRSLVTVASLVAAATLAGCHGSRSTDNNQVVGAGIAGAGVGAAIGSLAGVVGMLPGAAVGAAVGAGVQTATSHPYPNLPEDQQPPPAPNSQPAKP